MELKHGRDRFCIAEQEEQEAEAAAFKHGSFMPSSDSSSSPSSSSAAPFRRRHDGDGSNWAEREHMFDKVVTPSDVGKLNRLVIPKQHAERYLPLDASANEKGLLLSFEDRTGKSWRFRYSYWNSSQSYVMTKGWSRFVKEKRLDAGDTVSFSRGVGSAGENLYIDWKSRIESRDPTGRLPRIPLPAGLSFGRPMGPWGATGHFFMPQGATAAQAYPHRQGYVYNGASSSAIGRQLLLFRSPATGPPPFHVQVQPGSAARGVSMVLESMPAVPAKGKRVRLFGVNLFSPDLEGDDARGGRGGRGGDDDDDGCGSTSLSLLRSRETSGPPPLHLGLESSLASPRSSKRKEQHSMSLDLGLRGRWME